MKKLPYYISLILANIFFLTASAQVQGVVYQDDNGNGKKDEKERGIEGAILSNGLHVVKTNKEGEFFLPKWEKARFVTLYPNANHTVKKRYIHIEDDIKSYDFAIEEKEKRKEVSFIQISDTETYEYKEWLNDLKRYSDNTRPDFIIHSGDICYESGMEWHAKEVTTQTIGTPVYYSLGNHDLVKGAYGEEFFEKHFGPAWYAFEEGNSLYVITPMMSGDYAPSYTRKEIGVWLQNLLNTYPEKQPKYFFNHDLLTNGENFDFKIDEKSSIHLNDYNLKAWLFGHWHINMTKTHGTSKIKSYATTTAAKGGIDHSPSSFRVVNVDEQGNSSSNLKWTFVDNIIQIVSPHKDKAFKNPDGHIDISVNIYSSKADVDSVTYNIYDDNGLNWSSARNKKLNQMVKNSDWNWSTHYSPKQQSPSFTVAIEAHLNNGEVLYRKKTFYIKETSPNQITNGLWYNLGGNPEHDAVSNIKHSKNYDLAWVKNVNGNIYMSSPVLYKNNVLTASFDDNNATDNYIVCYNASTGKKRWKYQTKNGIKNQMIISEGIVIATDLQGFIYAIDIETGKVKWEKDLNYNRLPALISGTVTKNNIVYTGFGNTLSALDTRTGKTIWTNQEWNGGQGSTPTMTIADNILVTSSNWNGLYGHDLKTGKLLWKRSDKGLSFRNGNVLYKENTLWVAENDGDNGTIHLLNPDTGKTIKTINTLMNNKSTTTPIVTNKNIYIAGSDPGIAAIERKTGRKIWEHEVLPAIFYTPQYFSDQQRSIESTPILVGNELIFGAMDGWLYKLNATTGATTWKTYLGSPVLTSAAITKDGFFICDFAGNIYYFKNKQT